MSEIGFSVLGAAAEPYAAAPTLSFRLRLEEPAGAAIHSVALHCQIRIEAQRRRYSAQEEGPLRELFGAPEQWSGSLRPFLWTHANIMVPAFCARTEIDLKVPCTYDFEVAAAKYLHSLHEGEVPLLFLFSGSVFARAASGMQVTQLAWHKDASYRLPVRVWRELMDMYFPASGWLRLHRDILDRLLQFKAGHALASWDQVMEVLLGSAGDGVR